MREGGIKGEKREETKRKEKQQNEGKEKSENG